MRALLGLARGAKRQGPPIRVQADAKPLIEQALIPIAIAEIGIQLSNADAHDAKTLGYVAGLLAGATAVIALRPAWSPLWLVAITGLVASLTCFALVLQSRAFRSGPRITRLHDILTLPSASLDDGRAAVFSALVDDFERNAALLPGKYRWGVAGQVLGAITIVVGGAAYAISTVALLHPWLHWLNSAL